AAPPCSNTASPAGTRREVAWVSNLSRLSSLILSNSGNARTRLLSIFTLRLSDMSERKIHDRDRSRKGRTEAAASRYRLRLFPPNTFRKGAYHVVAFTSRKPRLSGGVPTEHPPPLGSRMNVLTGERCGPTVTLTPQIVSTFF